MDPSTRASILEKSSWEVTRKAAERITAWCKMFADNLILLKVVDFEENKIETFL